MPGRVTPFQTSVDGMSDGSDSYRYGFNGKENDFEPKNGQGSQQDYGMRIYDPRLGKFLSVDPLTKSFPSLTPYQFASNSPIANVDLDGLEASFFMYVYSEHINGEARFKLIPKKMVDAKLETYLGTIHTNLTDVSFVKGTDGHWHQIPKEWENKSFSEAGDFRAVFKMIDSWKINDEAYDAVIKGEALQKIGQKAEAAISIVMLMDGAKNIALKGINGLRVVVGGQYKKIYRGGGKFVISDKDIKIDPNTGMVKTTHGVSVNTSAEKIDKFGGAYEITSMPEELQIIQRGKDQSHFEIVPKEEMSKEKFQGFLNKIETKKVE